MGERRPQVGVGALVEHDDALLLVRRATQPGAGQWAIPGGRQRLGETLQQAAEREIREETGITIRAGEVVYTTEYLEHDASGTVCYHYVILDLAAEYLAGEVVAGDDAAEAAWQPFTTIMTLPLNGSTREALLRLYPERVTEGREANGQG